MVLMRRCATGLLAAAGSLGLLSSTEAAPPRSAPPIRLVGSLKVTPGQLRLEAMKVEMAWLADRVSYGLPLEVHVEGEGLRACGRVPDEAARQQVLEVARQTCCLPVADGLTVVRPEAGAQRVEARGLEATARGALRKELGPAGAELQVSADDHGQVTLRGEVATVEDKLAASRCLKGLPDCLAVVNALSVTPLRHAGHTVTLVTRDGQHAVLGAMPGSDGARTMPMPSAAPAGEPLPELPSQPRSTPLPYVLPPAPTPTLPSGLPPRARLQVIRGGHPTEEARPIRYITRSGFASGPSESSGYPGCEGKVQGMHLQVVQSAARPSLWERLTSFTRGSRQPEVISAAPPVQEPVGSRPLAPADQTVTWPKAHATAPVDAPMPVAPKPVSRPLAHLIKVQGKPMPAAPKLEPVKAEAPKIEPVAAPPREEPPVRQVVRVQGVQKARTPESIMQTVRDHCGQLARDVQVEVYKDGSTVVKVFAPVSNEQQIVGKLMGLPSLGAKVKVQVVLGR